MSISRANNARFGITGAMMYAADCFAQVLEGGFDAVQQTFERIQCDLRHDEVVVVQAMRIGQRTFGAWEMALVKTREDGEADALLSHALGQPRDEEGHKIVALLSDLAFREAAWSMAAE